MEYLIDNILEIDLKKDKLVDKIINNEKEFYDSIINKYTEIDWIKFMIYLRKVENKLFNVIKFIENNNISTKEHTKILKTYKKTYKLIEEDFKRLCPNIFHKNYEFWDTRGYVSPFLGKM